MYAAEPCASRLRLSGFCISRYALSLAPPHRCLRRRKGHMVLQGLIEWMIELLIVSVTRLTVVGFIVRLLRQFSQWLAFLDRRESEKSVVK